MALSPSSSSDQPTGLVNIASLLQTLAPIFLGGGPQTSTTSGGTTTTKASSSVGNAPDILSAILGSVNTAASNAQDTTKTDALVANIMAESARAFTPTIAAQNSAGLYNSSTLSLLSGDARARATAASSKAVLDYQTGQQQIAQQGLSTVAANNKSTTTEQATATPTSSTIKLQAPAINPITSLLTLGGGVLANKLLGSKTVEGAGSSFLDFLGNTGSNALNAGADALGFSAPFPVGTLSAPAITPTFAADSALSASGSLIGPAATPAITASDLSLSAAPGANFLFPGEEAGAAALSGITSSTGAEGAIGAAGLTSSIAEGGLDLGGAGGLASGFASDAAITGGAGALGGEAALAGIGSLGGLELGGAGALAAGFASDAAIAGGAGAAAGAGGIAGIGEIASTILEVLGAVVGWVVCTELVTQGKIDKKIYKYGMLHFSKYSQRSREAYWLWGSPLSSYIHRKPSSSITKVAAWVMKKRMEHIASFYEKRRYRKTVSNSLCFYGVGYSTFLLQIVLFIIEKRIELPTDLEIRTRRNATSLLLSPKGI